MTKKIGIVLFNFITANYPEAARYRLIVIALFTALGAITDPILIPFISELSNANGN